MASNIDVSKPNVGVPRLTKDGLEDNFTAAKEEIEDLQGRVATLEGGGAVTSVYGRTGAVVAVSGDYDADEIDETASNKIMTAAERTKLTGLGTESFIIAASDETTALTTGTAKATFRMPYAFTVSDVRASVTTAPTGAVLTVDINESGTTILSTKITIDATEKTSETAATAPVISDSSLADDAEMTIDIDTVGSTVAGTGLKVAIIGTQT